MDQALIDNVYKMTRPEFVKDGNRVSRPVQTLNMLAHELSLYKEKARATAAAKSIISMVTKGEGVKGGLRKATHTRRFFNKTEKELVRDALTKAADYLQTQNELDPFLEGSIGSMVGIWDDDATKKHGSIVLSLLAAAREKVRGTDIQTAKVRAGALIPDSYDAVLAQVIDDSNWRSATAYMDAPRPRHRYNAIAWKAIEDAREAELARETESVYKGRILADFPVKALAPTGDDIGALEGMAEQLEQTYVPKKALFLSNQIMGCLKHNSTDLRSIVAPTTTNQTNFRKAVIRALAAVEKFRRYELEVTLQTEAPKVVDYQDALANPENQAILLTLVTLVQKLIDYPLSSIDDLRDFFVSQRNDSLISATIQEKLALLDPGAIITEPLVEGIKRAHKTLMPITERQKILVDQQALEHRLIYEGVPEFNFQNGEKPLVWRFLRFIESKGDGQCGYYSIRNITDARVEYKRKFTDNLRTNEIRVLLERLVHAGRELHIALLKPDAVVTLTQRGIMDRINDVESRKNTAMGPLRVNGRIPETNQEAARRLDQRFEAEAEPLYTELAATAPLSDAELAEKVTSWIQRVDTSFGTRSEWIEIPPNVEWRDQPFIPPYIYSRLTHDDYYVWIKTQNRKRWPGGTVQPAIYENGKYMLATFVSARDKYPFPPRRIHLFNTDGEGHYDKWVEESNGRLEEGDDYYPDLTDALRHKKLYNLDPTRPTPLY
ncbi:MAG: hypothetical protein K2Q34_01640 [Alphaproteobacteria bacterium]|nr:hypothetical protein [Alphaproteobacteria bacterium]